jgi:hypothetical protein
MDRGTRNKSHWLMICAALAMVAFAAPMSVRADSNCSNAAACGDSLDDGNPGDNQTGDSGSDRDGAEDRGKPS